MSSEVTIGKIRTSFGVHGEVKVHSFSGEWDHFSRLKEVQLKGRQTDKLMTVEYFQLRGENPVMKLKGIDTPEDAKLLADLEIWVPSTQGAALGEGEYYLRDLVGCALQFEGKTLGSVLGFLEGGAVPLLEVSKPEGNTVIVPFQDIYVGDVDLVSKTIQLRVDWILE